jgi:hypothetical protein
VLSILDTTAFSWPGVASAQRELEELAEVAAATTGRLEAAVKCARVGGKAGSKRGGQKFGWRLWLGRAKRPLADQGTTRAVIEQGGQSEFVGWATHLPNIALGLPAPARAADLKGEVGAGG